MLVANQSTSAPVAPAGGGICTTRIESHVDGRVVVGCARVVITKVVAGTSAI